jgi:predicted RNA-binding Zn ribbon-like protein
MSTANEPAPKFEFVGGWLCLDFLNTINYAGANPNERLKTYADLADWGQQVELLGDAEAHLLLAEAERRPAGALEALGQARDLRLTLHRLLSAVAFGHPPGEADVAALGGALQAALARRQLLWSGDGFRWEWLAAPGELDLILPPVIWSAGELLTSGELARVKRCSGSGCSWLFYDRSKNHSRRWCMMAHCGNRAKARRHYARRKKGRAAA